MSYKSIDSLQKVLAERVFSHTKDSKKAAGRAIGTMIETITYYLLREWGISRSISIERGLPEYGNSEITHNVEFSLHPIVTETQIRMPVCYPVTAKAIMKNLEVDDNFRLKNYTLLSKEQILKNACVLAETNSHILLADVDHISSDHVLVNITEQLTKPYAMLECKRVGVEEGCKKGPQTIEKAKQGAYVAKTTSSLQKIRNDEGILYGIIYNENAPIIMPYDTLLETIINGTDDNLLRNFTLSIGIVSNHGNWFNSNNQNKELKVLAQSYDWLLFLTDEGLSQFIESLLLSPTKDYLKIREAFLNSYKEGKKINSFTKTKMDYNAHLELIDYFHKNVSEIEKWFNVITPQDRAIGSLKEELNVLQNKNWIEIYDDGRKKG